MAGVAGPGAARLGKARQGKARQGKAGKAGKAGTAWHGEVCRATARVLGTTRKALNFLGTSAPKAGPKRILE